MSTQEPTCVPRQAYDLLKSILLGVVVLTAGIVIGAGAVFMLMSHPKDRYGREPEIFAEQMLRQLSRELNLTPQQRRQLDPVLRQHHKTLSDLRAAVRPQIVSQLEQLNTDIASVLNPDQLHIWQGKIRRLEEHFPTFRGPGRGLSPGQRFGPEGGRGSGQGFGPEGGRGQGQGFGPEGGRGQGMGPGLGPEPGQEFMPGQRDPQGPRQPLGPIQRRGERPDPADSNVPPPPRPEPPRVMDL